MHLPLLLLGLSFSALATPVNLKLTQDGGAVTASQSGQMLWTQPLHGGPYQPNWKHVLGPRVAPLNVAGRVAHAVYCWEGQRLYCQTAGFDKRTGKPLFDLPGTPQAVGDGQLLLNFWGSPTDVSFDVVDSFRIDLLTGKAERIGFRIPPRPGCGALNYSTSLTTRYGAKYAYAQQDDQCGVFVARFDWHGAATQKPVLRVTSSVPLKR